jgi:hypothetical protein
MYRYTCTVVINKLGHHHNHPRIFPAECYQPEIVEIPHTASPGPWEISWSNQSNETVLAENGRFNVGWTVCAVCEHGVSSRSCDIAAPCWLFTKGFSKLEV